MQGDESAGRMEDECSPASRNGAGRGKKKAGQKMAETCSLLRSRLCVYCASLSAWRRSDDI